MEKIGLFIEIDNVCHKRCNRKQMVEIIKLKRGIGWERKRRDESKLMRVGQMGEHDE